MFLVSERPHVTFYASRQIGPARSTALSVPALLHEGECWPPGHLRNRDVPLFIRFSKQGLGLLTGESTCQRNPISAIDNNNSSNSRGKIDAFAFKVTISGELRGTASIPHKWSSQDCLHDRVVPIATIDVGLCIDSLGRHHQPPFLHPSYISGSP